MGGVAAPSTLRESIGPRRPLESSGALAPWRPGAFSAPPGSDAALSAPFERVEQRVDVLLAPLEDTRVALAACARALHVGEGALADGLPDRLAADLLEQLERLVEHLHGAPRDDAVLLELDLVAQ